MCVRGKVDRRSQVDFDGMTSAREDAHHLVDAVPDDRVDAVVHWLRQFTEETSTGTPRRQFRTTGVFDGEPDLAARAKEILRSELGGQHRETA